MNAPFRPERRGFDNPIRNAMTVDVEDYFQVQALAHRIPRESWESLPARVEANVEAILALFDRHRARATFFTLGWIAARHPGLVRRIVACGHELASHGWDHRRADLMDPPEFRADVGRARRTLEDIGGVAVRGYRAPTFSIGARNQWAFAILESEGYAYSSSVNPIRHDLYGMPDAPRLPYRPPGGALVEIPMTTLRAFGRNIPCSGGGLFRLLPYPAFQMALRQVNRTGRAGVFYFHPWEIDPGQPRIPECGLRSRLRHYTNLHRMKDKLDRLLGAFAWGRMDEVFAELHPDRAERANAPAVA
ncbi:MAG TPA: XrtA system polysaccharide deacetylase [Acetobacteraceae bacterium]|nr:XrtA system polysaccharide deacetylase [Acetobacteraceae bacterium]